ncbi:MAG TPA: HIT family protein [Candidatus Eisenbacteria bacterium]|nr:HIT family protein [Candidatus Eisenbacteria bacterium]
MTDTPCVMCDKYGRSGDALHIADLALSRVFLHEDQFFPGYVLLVLRRHVTELYDLPAPERATLMEEVSRVAQALAQVFRPVKMNYELLGNLVPRLATDPALHSPIWTVEHQAVAPPPVAARERIESIRRALA